jgi:hypothetical protein
MLLLLKSKYHVVYADTAIRCNDSVTLYLLPCAILLLIMLVLILLLKPR